MLSITTPFTAHETILECPLGSFIHAEYPAGLKVLFALLNKTDLVDLPYRQIAEITGVALGTVDGIFRDLNEMRVMVKMGKRKRKLIDLDTLRKKIVRKPAEDFPLPMAIGKRGSTRYARD